MKKLLLYIFAICIFQFATAQNFTINPKIAKGQGANTMLTIATVADFTNTGTEVEFEWKILEIVAPTEWAFGMCDPLNCLTDLKVGNTGIFTVAATKSGQFTGDFEIKGKSGFGTAKVSIYPKNIPANADTIIFQITAWPTGIKENGVVREFAYFPNPVKERLQIKYNTKDALIIDIYNVLGTKVKSFTHTGFESDINVGDLQNGIYFIRFREGNHIISKPFTKSE
ncbi:MAG: T9SS type A sorting domain-containing protein [Bacteroidota bacterium]|nr:T9SS type A sorting domain-containing protein [Bacteroidota bacterium]